MSDKKHKEMRSTQVKPSKDKKKSKKVKSSAWVDFSSSSASSSEHDKSHSVVDDKVALAVEAQWKVAYPDATLLPVIGLPSNFNGVGTLTHTMGDGRLLTINGLISKSALSNNALYSFECASNKSGSVCKYLNEYEIMIPDIPGKDGEYSTAEYYVSLLSKYGLSVAGVHFHWWGQNLMKGNTLVAAIHHQGIDISPKDFSRKTIRALEKTMDLVEKRSSDKL